MTATRWRAIAGFALAISGGILCVVSFGFLEWYDVPARADSASNVTFSALGHSADQLRGTGIAPSYFGWLARVLLILVVAASANANAPFGPTDILRVLGFTAGIVGVVLTYLAIVQLHDAQVAVGAEPHSVFANSTWGLWTAFSGFALCAAGGAVATRRAWT